ncbi:M48 family metallopeptidase [Candidatus Saccharibacteria bacterium]|nr:M48 family metallopeptidase [Candidatus Saccharibacteria bacterium]MBP9985832.1 M48 family metallopeptidase [Candidatus Saccharibacteria bacterium]
MSIINDPEFGKIVVRKYPSASSIKVRRAPNGSLRISAPTYAPNFVIKNFIKQSKKQLRELIADSTPNVIYKNGSLIGKSHSLITLPASKLGITIKNNIITVHLPNALDLNDAEVIDELRPIIIKALRKEAKGHLPRRLDYIAKQHGFSYSDVKFSHASSRWGSCRNDGRITLNIALMKLPFELIDYVIAHELSHTKEMNHSTSFWQIVESIDPNYKTHRRLLKNESPNI